MKETHPFEPGHPSQPRDPRRDLTALRYLDALNTGNLEAVAALWDEASRDPRLERMLAELDEALFTEQSVAGQSRLEEPRSRRPQRRAVKVAMAGALAAACLLAVFAWPGHDGVDPLPPSPAGSLANQVRARSQDDSARISGWLETRRLLNGAEMAAFNWPLPETSPFDRSRSFPPDLLD